MPMVIQRKMKRILIAVVALSLPVIILSSVVAGELRRIDCEDFILQSMFRKESYDTITIQEYYCKYWHNNLIIDTDTGDEKFVKHPKKGNALRIVYLTKDKRTVYRYLHLKED